MGLVIAVSDEGEALGSMKCKRTKEWIWEVLQGINILPQIKVKNEVPFRLCMVIKLYFGKRDTILELSNYLNAPQIWNQSVQFQ